MKVTSNKANTTANVLFFRCVTRCTQFTNGLHINSGGDQPQLEQEKDANFGNGRFVRNVFEKTLQRQANRLAREVHLTTDKLLRIRVEDLP